MPKYPYYGFKTEDGSMVYEGRFWNCQGKQIAIVAVVTDGIDWAAYIGTDAPNSYKEQDTCIWAADIWAAEKGCKLSEKDARHFFPDILLPYRS